MGAAGCADAREGCERGRFSQPFPISGLGRVAPLPGEGGAGLPYVRLHRLPSFGERLTANARLRRSSASLRIPDNAHRRSTAGSTPSGMSRRGSTATPNWLACWSTPDSFSRASPMPRSIKRKRTGRTAGALDGFLLELGRAVCRSWDSGFRDLSHLPRLQLEHRWPAEVELRVPEGYAFYALYPEAYIEAARRLSLKGAPRVIGIRSIGTSLGAVVAAALDGPPAVTVRPFGDPFARTIAIDPALERELLDSKAHYIIVDEGPGQSGSSFARRRSMARSSAAYPPERIAVLPSHAGAPGPAAIGRPPALVGTRPAASRRVRRRLASDGRTLVHAIDWQARWRRRTIFRVAGGGSCITRARSIGPRPCPRGSGASFS